MRSGLSIIIANCTRLYDIFFPGIVVFLHVGNVHIPDTNLTIVMDANGNIFSGQTVSFNASNGATINTSGIIGEDGTITVMISSINNNTQSMNVYFTLVASDLKIVQASVQGIGSVASIGQYVEGVNARDLRERFF